MHQALTRKEMVIYIQGDMLFYWYIITYDALVDNEIINITRLVNMGYMKKEINKSKMNLAAAIPKHTDDSASY